MLQTIRRGLAILGMVVAGLFVPMTGMAAATPTTGPGQPAHGNHGQHGDGRHSHQGGHHGDGHGSIHIGHGSIHISWNGRGRHHDGHHGTCEHRDGKGMGGYGDSGYSRGGDSGYQEFSEMRHGKQSCGHHHGWDGHGHGHGHGHDHGKHHHHGGLLTWLLKLLI